MFESIRPDAKNALELENVKKALLRYRGILLGGEKARFIIARDNSLLKNKVDEAYHISKSCELCERKCHVNREEGKLGICKVGNKPLISSAFQHWERSLSSYLLSQYFYELLFSLPVLPTIR